MTLFDPDTLREPPGDDAVRCRLTLAYDGTRFHGFAVNPGVPTVAGTLTHALERVLRHRVDLTCAGRTDRGVHAHGQVVDFLTRPDTDLAAVAKAVNALCGPEIVVRDAAFVAPSFSSRFDAVGRRYRYTIHNSAVPDPFRVHTAWHVKDPLDLALLRLGCDPLIGSHDFSAFCRRPKRPDGHEVSLVRDVDDARWEAEGPDTLHFWIQASSFCHQMVRSIVGTLVEVGAGRRQAGEVRSILLSRDRAAAGPVAPPRGLSLWHVRYPDDPSPG